MTYLSDREKRKKSIWRRSIFVVTLAVVVMFWPRIQSVLTPVSYSISEKVFLVSEFFSDMYDSGTHFFTTRNSYREQLNTLEKENDTLAQELAILREGKESLINAVKRVEVHTLFSSLSTVYDTFVISKGYSDGIATGMMVYTSGYLPIGIIDEVHPTTARVVLLAKNGRELEGFIGSSLLAVRLTGNGGGDFIATLPKQLVVNVGDTIFLKEYPQMNLGVVVSIDNELQSVSQRLFIRGAYSNATYQHLYIDLP